MAMHCIVRTQIPQEERGAGVGVALRLDTVERPAFGLGPVVMGTTPLAVDEESSA